MCHHKVTSLTGVLTNQLQSIKNTAIIFRSYTVAMRKVAAGMIRLETPRLCDIKMSGRQVLGNGQLDAASIYHGKIILYNTFAKGLFTYNFRPAGKHSISWTQIHEGRGQTMV